MERYVVEKDGCFLNFSYQEATWLEDTATLFIFPDTANQLAEKYEGRVMVLGRNEEE